MDDGIWAVDSKHGKTSFKVSGYIKLTFIFYIKYKSKAREKEKNLEKCQILSYSSVRNDYGVQALAPTITLVFYLMSFHFIQKENLIQENKALSLKLKIIII